MSAAPDTRILDLIQKLLRLAADPSNEHEAALAAQKAHEMLTRHKLTMAEIEARGEAQAEEYERDAFYVGSGYDRPWREKLITAICKYNYCAVVYRSGKPGHAWVVGKPSDIDICEYLFDYLSRTIARLATTEYNRARNEDYYEVDYDERGQRVKPQLWKREFCRGCVQTISNRLYQARKQEVAQAAVNSLVIASDTQLSAAKDRFFGELVARHTRSSLGHYGARQRGAEAGKTIRISPAVRSAPTRTPLRG